MGKKEASINRSLRQQTMVKYYHVGLNSLFWWVEKAETEVDLVPYFQSIFEEVVKQCLSYVSHII